MKPYSRVVHWTALFLFVCSLPILFYSTFQSPEKPRAAADYTCTSTGAGGNWTTPANWGGDCAGTFYPGSDSSKTYDVTIASGSPISLNADISINNADDSALGNLTVDGSLNINNNNIITIGSMIINTGGVVTAGASTINVFNNWTNSEGTINYTGICTVVFKATSSGHTINAGTSGFYKLTFNGVGGSWSPSSTTMIVTNDLTMTAGTLDNSYGNADVIVKRHVTGTGGVINMTCNTFTQRSPGAWFGSTTGTANWNFYNLKFEKSQTEPPYDVTVTFASGGTGKIIIDGALTIGNGSAGVKTILDDETNDRIIETRFINILFNGYFKASSTSPLTVSGSWFNAGEFNPGSGSVVFSGTNSTAIMGSSTFNNITFDTSSGPKSVSFEAGTTQTIKAGGTFAHINGSAENMLALQSTVSPTKFNFAISANITTGTDYIRVQDNVVNGAFITSGTGSTVIDCSGWDGVVIQEYTFSGSLYNKLPGESGQTKVTDSTSLSININGSVLDTTASNNGDFLFTLSVTEADNYIITVYTVGAGSYSTVVKMTDIANTDIDLFQGYTTLGSANLSSSISNADLAVVDFPMSSFTSYSENAITFYNELYIYAGSSYVPGGDTSVRGWVNAGTFDAGTWTVTFLASEHLSTGGTGENNDFYNLSVSSGGPLSPQAFGLKVVNLNIIQSGTLNMATYNQTLEVTGVLTIAQNSSYLTGTGSQTINSLVNDGTVTVADCNGDNLDTTTRSGIAISYPSYCTPPLVDNCKISAGTYQDLTLNAASGCNQYDLEGTVTISGGLGITDVTLAIGSNTLNMNIFYNRGTISIGSGTLNANLLEGNIVCDGESKINVARDWGVTAFTPSRSTVTFNGTSHQNSAGVAETHNWYNLVTANSAGVGLYGTQNVTNNLIISSGQLTLNNNPNNSANIYSSSFKNVSIESNGILTLDTDTNLFISGNWSNLGSFNASAGPVTFNGTGNSTISGSNTFNNLTMDASVDGAKTIYFAEGKGNTTTVNGTWNMKGARNGYLTLRSNKHGSAWYFNIPSNITSGSYIDVEYSHSDNSHRITPGTNVIDSGNNDGWNFARVASTVAPNETITTPTSANVPEQSAIANLIDSLQDSPVAQAIANVAEKVTQVTAAVGLLPLVANIVGGFPAFLHAINYGISLILEALGIRKRRKSWGRVYDSTTGKGIDTAIIRLYDQKEMTLKGTMITDIKGKYYFSADPGVYAISVSKDGYIFPTEIFAKYGIQSFNKGASRNNTQYVGQPINIDDKSNFLNIDVPMDPVKPNISTLFKIKIFGKDLFNYFLVGLPYIVIPALIIGSVLSIFTAVVRPTTYNIILSIIYVALTAGYIPSRYLKSAHAGLIIDKATKQPIPGVMISLFEKEHNNLKETRITDRYGRFSINAPKGKYYLKAQKSGYTFTIAGHENKDINLKESSYIREQISGEKKG